MTVRQSTLTNIAASRKVALLLGLFVVILSISVLAGWALDIAAMKSVIPGLVTMKANTAVGMMLCGAAVALLSRETIGKRVLLLTMAMAAAVVALAALSLGEDLFVWDLGIDQWLFRDTADAVESSSPGRMSPSTASCFVVLGSALLMASLPLPARLRFPVLSALGATVALIGGLALLGHVSGALTDARWWNYAGTAMHTAAGFVLLGCGLLALVRSEGGLKWSLDAVTTCGILTGMVAMIATAGVSYQFTSRLRDDAGWVSHTQEVLKEIQKLSAFLGDFTISAGRYIITRDERTLDGREKTKAAVQNSLRHLRGLTADNPVQQERLDQIERLQTKRVAMSDEIIAKFRRRILSGDPPPSGGESPLGQEYPALGREIERLVDVMEADKYALLDQRQKQSKATSTKTFLLLPLSVLLGLTTLALGLFFLNEGAAARAVVDARLARKRGRLSLLHEIDRAIIAAKSPAQIADAVLPRLRDMLGLPRVVVNLLDPEKQEVEWLVAVGRHRSHVGPGVRFSTDLLGDLEGLKRGEVQLIDVSALKQRTEAEALLASDVCWYRVVPMIVGDDLIGGLSFGGPSKDLPAELLEIAVEVAAQLAIAIAQSRLAERARRADARYRLIFENVPVGITMTTADGRFLSMNSSLARILGYGSVDEVMARLNGRVQGVYGEADAREKYLDILRRDGVVDRFETRFLRKDGAPIWVSMSGRPVDELRDEVGALVTMIDDISVRREQEHRIARLSRVKEMQSGINTLVVRAHSREELFNESCRIAVAEGHFKMAWIGVVDRNDMKIVPVATENMDAEFLALIKDRFTLREDAPLGNSMTARAIRERKVFVSNEIKADSKILFAKERIERGILSMAVFPLLVLGEVVAVLALYADEKNFFDAEEIKLLTELVDDIAFAMDNMEKQERLEYLAYYDALTGLPNRSLFHDRLSHSLRARGTEPRLVAVVLLDLERFRQVNETLGRDAGDELLRSVGVRLKDGSDSTARIGVDMFGLVLRGARTAPEVNRAIEAIVSAAFAEPFSLAGQDLRIACRAGVAVYPNDGDDADALLKNAEAALRRSKRAGDRVVFYAPEMNARAAEALAIETRLRGAVERREFVLHYQPKVALENGRIKGVEALIRWQQPGGGLVPPGQFIPILEETGMIVEVGRWAVEQAFADLRAWAAQGIRVPRVAVNVSAIQLQRNDFVDTIVDEIARGGDNPEWLELEITEGLVMRNVEDSIRKLSILRGMGATVAIDDFGTGYSSLSYLSRLPVDTLKIDRSFVTGVATSGDSTTLVTTVIALAHGLKLKVVAEGVETIEQANTLRLFRCDEAQGYLFSRPVPAGEIETMLRSGKALPVG